MPISLQKSSQLKAIAILMMLFLHLFNRDYTGLFQPLIFIGPQPLSYYISLFCDACVPVFAFVSGYGLYYKYQQNPLKYKSQNVSRIKNLYITYWIIILLFAVILGYVVGNSAYPGNWVKLLGNLTAVNPSYNGAWWFFTVYVLFVLTTSFWFKLLDVLNPWLYFSGLLLLYIVAFYFRVYKEASYDQAVIAWLHIQSALYFCTLFQFMAGAFALKYNWYGKVSALFQRVPAKALLATGMIVGLVVFHGLVPNFIIAPFTGLAFIFLFLQLKQPKVLDRILDFLAPHATNIWLVHMFFYMIYFPEFIYSPRYVLPIFVLLVFVSLLSSYLVKLIEKSISEMLFPSKPQT